MIFERAFVTGGAGFIGSHIVDHLVALGAEVTIYDNFSTGHQLFLQHHRNNPAVSIVQGDVLDFKALLKAVRAHDCVFHFQANADVKGGAEDTEIDLQQNIVGTWSVLEAMRQTGIPNMVFASSATVYGEPAVFPTPEETPLVQTSLYGASKLAGEAMVQAFAEYYGFSTWAFRFVSWIGERYTHGVVFDLIKKLKSADKGEIELLGDGKQVKSYLHVHDGISAVFHAIQSMRESKTVLNVGHDDFMEVTRVADIVADEMGLPNVGYRFAGGRRGWPGDSPMVHLDTTKLKALGWRPKISIEDGLRATVRYLMQHPALLERS